MGRWWWSMIAACVVGTAGGVLHAAVDTAATVSAPAERGDAVSVVGDDPGGCERVAVVGDSLTWASRTGLRTALADAGFDAIVDGQISRRIPGSVSDPYSGVRTARAIRASWGDAECWVVALGSNDLQYRTDVDARFDAMIAEMVSAVTPDAHVWWVNVNYLREPGSSFDYPTASRRFNSRLALRESDTFRVIDWYALSASHPEWFDDAVHLFPAGYRARTDQIVAALTAP